MFQQYHSTAKTTYHNHNIESAYNRPIARLSADRRAERVGKFY